MGPDRLTRIRICRVTLRCTTDPPKGESELQELGSLIWLQGRMKYRRCIVFGASWIIKVVVSELHAGKFLAKGDRGLEWKHDTLLLRVASCSRFLILDYRVRALIPSGGQTSRPRSARPLLNAQAGCLKMSGCWMCQISSGKSNKGPLLSAGFVFIWRETTLLSWS